MGPPRSTTSLGRAPRPDPEALAAALRQAWPDAHCELDHADAYQLLCATILAAQSTDRMINTLTPALFARYPDAHALAAADPAELEPLIFRSGFYRAKARSLIGMARALVLRHGGAVPRTMDEMVALPGVARKTGNVVLSTALGVTVGVVVDTHVTRLAARLGLTTETDPVKIERDLMAALPRAEWKPFADRLIWHGRRVCHAKAPACDQCTLAPLCPSASMPGTAAARPERRTKPKPNPNPSPKPKPKPKPNPKPKLKPKPVRRRGTPSTADHQRPTGRQAAPNATPRKRDPR